MKDGRIEGLPDPVSEFDAARKKYVDDRDKVMKAEMKNLFKLMMITENYLKNLRRN